MKPFKYQKAKDEKAAVQASKAGMRFLAGGTNLVDLMKEGVESPSGLVDINGVKLNQIRATKDAVVIGALARNKDTANHPLIREHFPMLTRAILAGASAQIRNMATNGGNINQRTRCMYFYDTSMPCNKRNPGSGCAAIGGLNRMHAVFGWDEKCVAVHPSDMAVALSALNASINVIGSDGATRKIVIGDYHTLPAADPSKDNTLRAGELVTSIELPKNRFAANSYYLKVRDRASYAFALVSVAAGLALEGGKIADARVSLGGVAHKPWRVFSAEAYLKGKVPTAEVFAEAGVMAMEGARALKDNAFKIKLAEKAVARALEKAANTKG